MGDWHERTPWSDGTFVHLNWSGGYRMSTFVKTYQTVRLVELIERHELTLALQPLTGCITSGLSLQLSKSLLVCKTSFVNEFDF